MNYELRIKGKIILIAILLLATALRFWRLDSYPALNADEAAIGYNAYSLLETGRDEHGNPWPIHFQSFNDYKPGLYFYMAIPFVKVLGLNELAVRIPGATLGVLTVLVLYFLVRELFPNEKKFTIYHFPFTIAEISALMLAISPWHIHFSRGAWEVNTATFLITLGLLFFLKAIKNPSFKAFTFSLLPFTLSLYTYHAARIVVPFLGLGALVIYWREIKRQFKIVLPAFIIFIILLAPLAIDLTKGNVFSRAAGVGLFADSGPLNRINELRGEHIDFSSVSASLLHNKIVNYGLAFLDNWARHFHGEFLFLSGDVIERNRVPETGQMYLFDIVLLLSGFGFIFKTYSKNPKSYSLILFWLIVSPFAAALTFQSPHALRAQNMVIPLVIVSALGLNYLVKWLEQNIRYRNLLFTFYFLLFTLIAWNFARYEQMYWQHMAKEYSFSSQYGVKELVQYTNEVGSKYDKIVVSDRYDQPYILFLFYLKYPPEKFQAEHTLSPRDAYGFSTVNEFDKYNFVSIGNWDQVRTDYPNSLIAGTPEEIPDEANVLEDIYGTNNHLYFQVVGN